MAGERGSWSGPLALLWVGTLLVACILVGYGVGAAIDRRRGGGTMWTAVGVLVGTAAGFAQMWRILRRFLK